MRLAAARHGPSSTCAGSISSPPPRRTRAGREILARFPDAERVPVRSHWQIPELHGNAELADDWNRVKRTTLVLGVRKSMASRPNGRSADFVGPGASNGCAMACAYCYVARRKGFANPITVFVNNDQILAFLARHAARQGQARAEPGRPRVLGLRRGRERRLLGRCADLGQRPRHGGVLPHEVPNAKASFATKYVNPDLLGYDPKGKTRIRFSLMPEGLARLVDVRTTPVAERIAAMSEFEAAPATRSTSTSAP